jgi:hypothetical protein
MFNRKTKAAYKSFLLDTLSGANRKIIKSTFTKKGGKLSKPFIQFIKSVKGFTADGVDLLKGLGKAYNPITNNINKRIAVYTKKDTYRAKFKKFFEKQDQDKPKEGDVETTFYPEKYSETGEYENVPINHAGWWFTYLKNSGLTGKRIRVIIKFYAPLTEDIEDMQLDKNGAYNYILDKTFKIPKNPSKKRWYEKMGIMWDFIHSSPYPNIIAYILSRGIECKIILTTLTKLTQKQYAQNFAEGGHCLLGPIKKWAEEAESKAPNEKSKERYTTILNKINGKQLKKKKIVGKWEKYASGVPESEIEELCDDLQIAVTINQPFRVQQYLECKSIKKSLKHFKFLNTRMHHVEHLTTQSHEDNSDTEYTAEELEQMVHQFRDNGTHCTFSRNARGIAYVQTLTHQYKITDAYANAKRDFHKLNNINSFQIDAIKYPELIDFISRGTHFNGTTDFLPLPSVDHPELRHIDIIKAYTQFEASDYYTGFVGKITDFRRVDNYTQKGFYYIENFQYTDKVNEKFRYYNEKMKWFISSNVYTDAELSFLDAMGCSFSVVYGAYGTRAKIQFTNEMINGVQVVKEVDGKPVKISYYAKCVGQWASLNYENSFNMYGSREYFETLANTDISIQYDDIREEANVQYAKQSVPSLKHLAGQITAYQRLLVIEQLLAMNESVIRVCVDGIYYYDHEFKQNEIFADKTDKMTFNNSPTESYLSGIFERENVPLFADVTDGDDCTDHAIVCKGEARPYYERELWAGQGGTGKTYQNTRDHGWVNALYVAPSWKLARAVQHDLQNSPGFDSRIDVNVKHRVLFMEFSDKLQARYNVFLFDEVSQYTEREKELIFAMDGRKIFMGDISYQLEPVLDYTILKKKFAKERGTDDSDGDDSDYDEEADTGEFEAWCMERGEYEITATGFDNIITLTDDYRAKDCQTLQNIKQVLREYVDAGREQDHAGQMQTRADAITYIKTQLPMRTREEVHAHYSTADLILCSKHDIREEYNTTFNHLKKYLVKNNTKQHSNGEIIYTDPPPGVKADITHGYTVHSIQGETLATDATVYIDLRRMFSDRMLYTAVSRARRMDQIYLVE